MKVWLIGAGPGDPELITRKAWRLLSQAEVILHDALMDVEGMKMANLNAKWVEVGKRNDQPSVEQAFICRALVGYAKQGLNVVRLKGGDPSIFGRAAEEIRACRENGIDIEIVPGVTAACSAAADLQTSLTLRGVSRSVAFVTPRVGRRETDNDQQWLRCALVAETVVLYMAGTQAKEVGTLLIEGGRHPDTPVCVVESASRSGARLKLKLADIAQNGLEHYAGPVSLLVGEALGLAKVQSESESQSDPFCANAPLDKAITQAIAFG
ncbi:uroporphyrinogen-III C-methyltransferase [Orrella sp. NBD-18]|uniref:uroporphyrinogen-III C-methyltransferase n=1 Tax=Sheuella amnicola TaxID=2707330 RepID=A0A6B2QZM7_9BURK|nr:uroporphyrinogen-III C-methyltransferase [Sheuella amnicola]NDY83976.1 uroporphyrinogen-III C-methyltransferase [Sheuella amnicola]HBI82922.1 uroporphyrinogen-III C-methyltransferase [Alcaligenaceae bacterium]